MPIKQSTIEAIADSEVIMVSFDKYGEKTKISLTWHTIDHAYTVEAWAKMNTLNELISLAKVNATTSDWPYGEAYYKDVIARHNPSTGRTTFTINYKRASKAQVEEYLKG